MMETLRQEFRPEFINRIDDIIVFQNLTEEDTQKIAALMLDSLAKRLVDKNIHIVFDGEVVKFMAKEGISDTYGARPLRRMIQQRVEDKLSEEILSGRIALGDHVSMAIEDGEVAFRKS
jgi:ATPases with chaperone activity, ATP-binding subunit